ncbi:MAG: DUF4179 domain-containing protein [Clostridiales bacterium]|jgi:hypothetical protein|nr:DUF4179 domain-containing protein [Clostridiales bacterium]
MIERTYKSMNEQIRPSPGLISHTLYLMEEEGKTGNRTRSFYRGPLAITAIAVICFLLAGPVFAVNVPSVYDLMYLVSPDIAQYFAPIRESCEDNGIRMEVVSTYIHDNTAEIYVAMQDLTGDRIDGTTDLFDSYSINRAFDSAATCERVGYDEETKTVTFLIQITEWGSRDIEGSKMTFSVREFLSHKTKLEDVPVDIALAELSGTSKTQEVQITGGGGKNVKDWGDSMTALVPQIPICTPLKGIDVTAAGYVDGKLHLQLATRDKLTYDSHGYFYLLDSRGNKIGYVYSVSFAENIESDERIDYQEFVFDIPQDEIGNYSLFGSFYTSGLNTKGNWRVTFPLVPDDQQS